MAESLRGRRVALLVANGFEQVELSEPKKALEDAGAEAVIVSPVDGDEVKGWKHTEWGDTFPVDQRLAEADPTDFDALVLPGGQMNPDNLRIDDAAVRFVRAFVDADKPIGAICHGPWTLIEADAVRGVRMTSWPSLKTDLRNAGADWVDEEVVVHGQLVTSRKPDDLEAFCAAIVDLFAAQQPSRDTPERPQPSA